RTNCDAVTFKAVSWTLTRRNTQGRQYAEGKAACFDSVAHARRVVSADQQLAALGDDLAKLTTLLESIQSEHTDETKMVTVGRLEREVQPLNASISARLDDLTRAADRESERLMTEALDQQQRMLWISAIVGAAAVVIGAFLVHVVTRRIIHSVSEAVTVATALSEGDLGVAPRVRSDERLARCAAPWTKPGKAG